METIVTLNLIRLTISKRGKCPSDIFKCSFFDFSFLAIVQYLQRNKKVVLFTNCDKQTNQQIKSTIG